MPTTVDKIRRALEKRDGIAEEEMRPLAEAYRTEVQDVNQRLDESVMLLRKGLRSEAIQRVEMTPNALDAATELEFPEWDEWNEILQFMGIPLPPKLNQDHVAQINEAIIESLPLDALLRRHRRLAIAKAPLSIRLRTLRQIARVDSANPVWADDVEEWEKARLSQIDSEMKSALEKEDAQTLYLLHRELTGNPWRVSPSSRLVEQCAFAAEAHVRQNQERELGRLAPQLKHAFERRDETAARALRGQWQTARAKYNLSVPTKMQDMVAPTIQWLGDLDRQSVMESERKMAIDNLQSSLDANASIEDVRSAYDQASRFGQPVPDELSHRVEALANKPKAQAKRKFIAIAVAAGLAALLLVVGGVMMMVSSNQEGKRQAAIDQMSRFVEAEQYDDAVEYYRTLMATTPDIAGEQQMVALHVQAKSAVDKELARIERFDKLLAQADSDDPALIDEGLLPQLDELAVTPGEQARVDELRKRKDRYLENEAMRQSDEMLGKIAEYQSTFSELSGRGSSRANRQAIQQLLAGVSRLPKQFPLRTSDVLAKQETLRSQISSQLSQMKDRSMVQEQRDEAIDSLVNSRSLEVYSDRLREFSTQSVSRTNFVEFRTVIDEEDHWLNVERTNKWLESLAAKLNQGVTSGEATTLIESAESLQSSVSPNPALDAMPGFIPALNEIVGRRVILNTAYSQIQKHPIAKSVTLPIREDSGTIEYYLYKTFVDQNAARMNSTGNVGVPIISDSLGGTKNRSFNGPLPKTSDEPMNSVGQAAMQKARLTVEFDQNWEQTFLRQVSEVMRDPDLDSLIKEWLIFRLLTAATQGSERLKSMIPQTMRTLQRRAGVHDQWFEPREFNAALNEEVNRMIRAELPVAFKRFENPLEEFETVSRQKLQWIGFLAKSAGGQIEAHVRGTLPEDDGTLYVAAPASEGATETSILRVGNLEKGHIQLTPNPVHQIPGRPLFLFPSP